MSTEQNQLRHERNLWRQETWDEVVNVLREHFQENGFEVHVNDPAGRLTIIYRDRGYAFAIAPVSSNSHGTLTGAAAIHV